MWAQRQEELKWGLILNVILKKNLNPKKKNCIVLVKHSEKLKKICLLKVRKSSFYKIEGSKKLESDESILY